MPDRRKFIKNSVLSSIGLAAGSKLVFGTGKPGASDEVPQKIAKPHFAQMEWQDAEIGVIFHFDISVATKNFRNNNAVRETLDPQQYDPVHLDTDQWLSAAKAAGATYAVFTATHFGGFLQWQSDLYPYSLKQAKWRDGKGDILSDFIQSCYKYNIKPGIYLSLNRNAYWHADNHFVDWGKGKGTPEQEAYNRMGEKMTEELCSRYGRLLEIWFDARTLTPEEGGPDALSVFEKYQPHSNFYSSSRRSDFRWVGNEKGYAGYPCWATMPGGVLSHGAAGWKDKLGSGDANGEIWSPAMVDVPLRGANGIHDWFYIPDHEKGIYSVESLMDIYERSVGRNANMVIGVVIDPDGLVPEKDKARLAGFGAALKDLYGNVLEETKGTGTDLTLELSKPSRLKRYIVQENIEYGERIQSYVIKGRLENGSWIELDKGSCVGHKRIGSINSENKFVQIQLHILENKGLPLVRNFSVIA